MLIILFFLLPKTLPWFKKDPQVDFSRFEQYVDAMKNPLPPNAAAAQLFEFNPNTIAYDSLLLLGLSEKTASTIIRYRNKGGLFASKTDLQKIYTLTPEQYAQLDPFIMIPKTKAAYNPQTVAKMPEAAFDFDPNTASLETLLKLGFRENQAKTLINYRKKGGRFHTKADLKKIYGIGDALFDRLEPHVQIQTQEQSTEKPWTSSTTLKSMMPVLPAPIDINQAAEDQWQTLRGIGPAYAKRIIGYREKLGGFNSIDQVATTYGLPDSTFREIKPFLKPSPIYRKLAVNFATVDELRAHPYLSYKVAQLIINYRTHHGAFHSVDDLAKIRALPPDLITKLEPYLNFDEEL